MILYIKIKFFWNLIYQHQQRAYLLFLLLCLSALFETLSIGAVFPLLTTIIQPPSLSNHRFLIGWLFTLPIDTRLFVSSSFVVLLFLIRSVIILCRDFYAARFSNALRHMWSIRIFENFLYGDLLKIKQEKQGHTINLIYMEPVYAAKSIRALIDASISFLVILAVGSFLIWLNPWFTLSSLVLVTIGIGLLWRISTNYSANVGKSRVSCSQSINHVIAESVTGIRQIKVYSYQSRALKEIDSYLTKLERITTRFSLVTSAPKVVGEFLVIVLIVSALCVSHFVLRTDLSLLLPEAAVFALSLMKLFSMGSLLLSKRMEVATYWPSVKFVHSYSSQRPAEFEPNNHHRVSISDTISIRNLSFAYPHCPSVLSGLSLNLSRGQLVGLVGSSGSGKSTLCDILGKFIIPTSGNVYIDNQPLTEISRPAWRRCLGYISQDPFFFHSSIKENIKLGKPDATDEEVIQAAISAQAHTFIESMADGYETVLGLGGAGLSGGQKQRIAIAQAFLRSPDLFIFDEATSGLDTYTESLVLEALHKQFPRSISILITHRLSSLRYSDRIYVFHQGKIIESGSYDQLMQEGSYFYSLVQNDLSSNTSSPE
jgi:ABC-type bacteriocin/lantibiotic exporter with double-glycine peptidase domain